MPTAEPTWLTLPPLGEEISDELKSAMESFDAGERPAARAATSWLRDQALSAYETSRTRVLVADGRVAGFYALASSHAVATARRASALQATAVLAVDPFDEETADQAVACHAPVGTPCIPRSASMLAKHESSDPLGSATGDLVSGQGRDGEAHEAGSFHDPEPDRSTGRPKGVDARTPACG
jgi:hypothetical protein